MAARRKRPVRPVGTETIERLEPMSLAWNFPKVTSGTVPEPKTPEPAQLPARLQGARMVEVKAESSKSKSKYIPRPRIWMETETQDGPGRQKASGKENAPHGQENAERATASKSSQTKDAKDSSRSGPDGWQKASSWDSRGESSREGNREANREANKEANRQSSSPPWAYGDPRPNQRQWASDPRQPSSGHGDQRPSSSPPGPQQNGTMTDDETARKNILVGEVSRIYQIKQLQFKFDWIHIFNLESGFGEKDLERKKRDLFRILHPDKSAKYAKDAGGEERLKAAYDFVDVAYSDAKKWLDQKNKGYLQPWERDPFDSFPPSHPLYAQYRQSYPANWRNGSAANTTASSSRQSRPTTPPTPTRSSPPLRKAPPQQPDSFRMR